MMTLFLVLFVLPWALWLACVTLCGVANLVDSFADDMYRARTLREERERRRRS